MPPDQPTTESPSPSTSTQILVVCSGNICRSPIGEVLLRQALEESGLPASVSSAGTLTVDRPADPAVVELMAARGIDVSGHRSQLLTPELVGDADLVLGMARSHVRDAAMAAPESFERTFTLKELVRRGESVGARAPEEDVRAWLLRVGEGRVPAELLGDDEGDDVADPYGRRFKVFQRVAAEIDDLTERLVRLLVPLR